MAVPSGSQVISASRSADAEVREHLRRRGGVPMVAMVFFDSETEEICREQGYNLILPPDSLRRRLDSKIVTTQLGDEAGAPSVPNVLGKASSYAELTALASGAGLGTDLVVQTPYGDSGKTTFFIASEPGWDACEADLGGQQLKVMKRINNQAAAVEACITRHGTIVGPFMTDLTGYPELTPYKGGWCGNDLFPDALSEADRAVAISHVRKLGDRLAREGYKGFLEVDVLVDADTGAVYLGELNPRISGVSSMTNVTAGAYADVPLFLFHLLEFMEVDYSVDVEEINERWRDLAAVRGHDVLRGARRGDLRVGQRERDAHPVHGRDREHGDLVRVVPAAEGSQFDAAPDHLGHQLPPGGVVAQRIGPHLRVADADFYTGLRYINLGLPAHLPSDSLASMRRQPVSPDKEPGERCPSGYVPTALPLTPSQPHWPGAGPGSAVTWSVSWPAR